MSFRTVRWTHTHPTNTTDLTTYFCSALQNASSACACSEVVKSLQVYIYILLVCNCCALSRQRMRSSNVSLPNGKFILIKMSECRMAICAQVTFRLDHRQINDTWIHIIHFDTLRNTHFTPVAEHSPLSAFRLLLFNPYYASFPNTRCDRVVDTLDRWGVPDSFVCDFRERIDVHQPQTVGRICSRRSCGLDLI